MKRGGGNGDSVKRGREKWKEKKQKIRACGW
jgi:hypothetical protein